MNIQKKLDLIGKHINELDAHLKKEYGPEAQVFVEPESGIYAMTHDECGEASDRQDGIIASTKIVVRVAAGAW